MLQLGPRAARDSSDNIANDLPQDSEYMCKSKWVPLLRTYVGQLITIIGSGFTMIYQWGLIGSGFTMIYQWVLIGSGFTMIYQWGLVISIFHLNSNYLIIRNDDGLFLALSQSLVTRDRSYNHRT